MNNKPIRLTEQDLHFLVENAVQSYLTENGMDEGVGGYLSGMFNRGSKQVQNTGGNLAAGLQDKWNQTKDYAKKQYGRAKQGIQNYQRAGQVSSINQDAQKAITNAYNSLDNLLKLSTKLKGITGYEALGPTLKSSVENCMNALRSNGNLRNDATGQFAAQRDTAVNPNAQFYGK